jgi:hypothetical protein
MHLGPGRSKASPPRGTSAAARRGMRLAAGLAAAIAVSSCGASEPAAYAVAGSGLARPSGGYLEHARSPITPFCHAVLVAPDVVVAAAACAEDGWLELSFGVGELGGDTIPVDGVMFHPDGDDPAHALVALRLARPIDDAPPAVLGAASDARDSKSPTDRDDCGVQLPSYSFVLRGEPGERAIWTACAIGNDAADLVAIVGHPNCHGDAGAGAYAAEAGDVVIGWVTGAGHLGAPHPVSDVCVTSVRLATVEANLEFLDAARHWSRSP